VPKFNKRKVIERIIPIPKLQKRAFWAREMKILNSLIDIFPKEDFWQKVRFYQEFDSLTYLLSPFGKNLLQKKYNQFNFKIKTEPKPQLGEKIGKDSKTKKKPNSIKDFFK
jgi:hypothetical protein